MKKKKKIIISLLIIIILLIIILFVTTRKKEDKDINKKKTTTSAVATGKWITPSGSASLIKVYMVKDAGAIVTSKEGSADPYANSKNHKLINSYRCYLSNCESYGSNRENSYVIIKDDGYLIYDYDKNLLKKTKLPNADYNSVDFLTYEGKDYGLSVSSINEGYAFYDLEEEKFKTDFKYSNIFTEDTACLSKGYFTASNMVDGVPKFYLVDYKKNKVIKETDIFMGSIGNGEHVYYYENYSQINGYEAIFYNYNFKQLFDGKTYSTFGVSKSGNLVVKNEDESFSIYTNTGTLVKKSKPYKEILIISNDYVVVKDNDDYLKIIDYDGNVSAKFVRLSNGNILDINYSGIRKIKGEPAIYLSVINLSENTNTSYYYNFNNKESGEVKTFD